MEIQSPVYLSGPMSGLPQENYPAFHAAAEKLRSIGYTVISPAEQQKQNTWEAYMKQDLALLDHCNSMVLLDGWENSRGANIEVGVAKQKNMQIIPLWAAITLDYQDQINDDLDECVGFSPR